MVARASASFSIQRQCLVNQKKKKILDVNFFFLRIKSIIYANVVFMYFLFITYLVIPNVSISLLFIACTRTLQIARTKH